MKPYPYYLKYSQVDRAGILAGHEFRSTHGVQSIAEAKELIQKLIASQPTVNFRNVRVVDDQKGLVANLLLTDDAVAVDIPA